MVGIALCFFAALIIVWWLGCLIDRLIDRVLNKDHDDPFIL